GERSSLNIRSCAAPLKLAFDVNISCRPTLKIEGVLAADADSLRETLGWTAFASSPGGGFGRSALKAHTNVVGGNISLSDVNIELDGHVADSALFLAG